MYRDSLIRVLKGENKELSRAWRLGCECEGKSDELQLVSRTHREKVERARA